MKTIYIVDYRISKEEYENLKNFSDNIILCPQCKMLYTAIDGHADIQIHKIDNNRVMVHKNIESNVVDKLKAFNIEVLFSKKALREKYPEDILLNALNLENYFVHNLAYTDSNLLELVKDKILINIKQGYTKCSVAVVRDNAIITSDTKIAETLKKLDIDVLYIPSGDILLEGLDYGFIGGTCGKLDENTLGFFGSLDNYRYGREVVNFLKKHKVDAYYLSQGKLIDRGSLFSIFR